MCIGSGFCSRLSCHHGYHGRLSRQFQIYLSGVGRYHRLDGYEFEQAPGVLLVDWEAWRAAVYVVTE